jgi:hypothetical protein
MYTLFRQFLVAILGGVVAVAIMLVADYSTNRNANHNVLQPSIALAQTSISSPNAADQGAPHFINYQGQVYNPNGGAPYANTGLNFSFRLYNDSAGTRQLYVENKHIITNVDGFFNTNIGDTASFGEPYDIFNGQALYLRIYINDQELGPIQTITYVPYAMWARHANKLDEYSAADFPKLIAFGVVADNGNRESGEDFDSDREIVGEQPVYVIDIDDVDFSIHEYTAIITPACQRRVFNGVGSSEGDMVVDMWDSNGNRTECRFQFMVLAKEKS